MRFYYFFILAVCFINTAFSLPLETPKVQFNVKEANQQLYHINLQMSVQNLNLDKLKEAVNHLARLVNQSDQCVDETQKKITNFDSMIQQSTQATDNNKNGADLVYLNNERKKEATRQAQCRLFSIRGKEAISVYQSAIAQLQQEQTFTRGLPIWELIAKMHVSEAHANFIDVTAIKDAWGKLPTYFKSLWFWLLAASINLTLSMGLFYQLRHNRIGRRFFRLKSIAASQVFLLAMGLMVGEMFLWLLVQEMSRPLLTALSGLLSFFICGLILTLLLFKLKKIRTFFYWYALNQDFFRHLLIFTLSLMTLMHFEKILRQHKIISGTLGQLNHSILLLTLLATALYMIIYFCRSHRHFQFLKQHRCFIQRASILLFLSCALADLLGYHTLADHLTLSLFTTFFVILGVLIINQGIKKTYLVLTHDSPWNAQINRYFGYRKDQDYTELVILKTALQVILVALALFVIGKSWAFSAYYVDLLYAQIYHGIHMGNFTLYPLRIVIGAIVFCLMYLLFRGIATYFSRHQQLNEGEEIQVAIASILTYIGFAIAFVSSLLVAGFNFTGLAIVAGALSVGIGLGLQSIVNNFVSGLILLIEKPIKPGDRINVEGVEGTVKKIRVRSTQIVSPGREDIIVPNSDLITRRVINYMYTDRQLSISCQVGVAYDSDVQLVKDLLLKAANQHEEVIKTGRNKPSVVFRSFGESSLNFQVGCLIRDGNKKATVQSDLNFAIEKSFRENQIRIAFPQREVRLNRHDIEDLFKNPT